MKIILRGRKNENQKAIHIFGHLQAGHKKITRLKQPKRADIL